MSVMEPIVTDELTFGLGDVVVVSGLAKRPELNGRRGLVLGDANAAGRLPVRVGTEPYMQKEVNAGTSAPHGALAIRYKAQEVLLKPQNLRPAAEPDLANTLAELCHAVGTGKEALLEVLLSRRASWPRDVIDAPTNQRGSRLLSIATQHGHVGVVRRLLEVGADPEQTDENGATPFAHACSRGQVGVVRLLLEHDAGPRVLNRTDVAGSTPLMVAATYGRTELTKVLLAAGATASLEVKGPWDGETALATACRKEHEEIVRLLLEADAEVNADIGNPPLHAACQAGSVPIAQLLLDASAELDHPAASSGATPLAVAVQEGQASVFAWLLSHGADPARPNALGASPVMVALLNGHEELAEVLVETIAARDDPPMLEQAEADMRAIQNMHARAIDRAQVEEDDDDERESRLDARGHVVTREEIAALEPCAICLEPFERCDRVMTLACGHTFKMLCFINWAGSCPMCREDVPMRQREGPTPSELRRDAPVPLPPEDHERLAQSIATWSSARPPRKRWSRSSRSASSRARAGPQPAACAGRPRREVLLLSVRAPSRQKQKAPVYPIQYEYPKVDHDSRPDRSCTARRPRRSSLLGVHDAAPSSATAGGPASTRRRAGRRRPRLDRAQGS